MDYHDAKKRVSDYVTVNLEASNKKDDDMDIDGDHCSIRKPATVGGKLIWASALNQ